MRLTKWEHHYSTARGLMNSCRVMQMSASTNMRNWRRSWMKPSKMQTRRNHCSWSNSLVLSRNPNSNSTQISSFRLYQQIWLNHYVFTQTKVTYLTTFREWNQRKAINKTFLITLKRSDKVWISFTWYVNLQFKIWRRTCQETRLKVSQTSELQSMAGNLSNQLLKLTYSSL